LKANNRFKQTMRKQKRKGRRAMARTEFGYLPRENPCQPRENPCAQCGKPITAPEWVESGPQRTSYLWQCRACGYRFEAVAFFAGPDSTPLAA
jgi:DNA-directed RNA polymerase subunit RPC12/RpoP